VADKPDAIERAAAKQLANETMREAASAEWFARRSYMKAARGGDLALPESLESTRTQAIYARALAKLEDTALHDPDPKYSNQACELILNYAIETQRIQAGLDAKHPIVEAAQPTQQPANDLTREEKVALARSHLKLARGA
jgi:hypothetical protein